jgi:hypothetical protein
MTLSAAAPGGADIPVCIEWLSGGHSCPPEAIRIVSAGPVTHPPRIHPRPKPGPRKQRRLPSLHGGGDAGYELQILDNYNNKTYVNGMAGSIYKQAIPLANACRKPGEWQSYDVAWTAPRFTVAKLRQQLAIRDIPKFHRFT